MPLVKYGFGISDVRGSTQGTTFSRCSVGNIFYRKSHIVNKRTSLQTTQRQWYYYYCNYWRNNLSISDKTKYNNLASQILFTNRLGDTFFLSGFNFFIKQQFFHHLTGILTIATAQAVPGLASPLVPNTSMITITAATNLISFVTTAFLGFTETLTTDFILVYATPISKEKLKLNDKYFRFAGWSHGAGGGGGFSPSSITIPWALSAGYYIRIKIKHYDQYGRFWEECVFQKIIV